MLFTTLQYAYFLPLVVLTYYVAPKRFRYLILLVASYLFYASWNTGYLLLIIGLTVINYGFGLTLGWLVQHKRSSVWLLILAVGLNLTVLGYYKYTFFLLNNLAIAAGVLTIPLTLPNATPLLPLGISFFIFEFIHYLVDVRKGQPVITSLLKFALFAAFFPTQIAGPIKRYEAFVPQLDNPAPLNWSQIGTGLRLLQIGLFKKVAIADNMSPIVMFGFQQIGPDKPGLIPSEAWLIVLAFAMQIYFDFAAYTDIGRGSAFLLGFTVPENFTRPYLAGNISEFWRRWHISLSSWLRDYLYIPLGGNRHHRYRNLLLTMILGGLWHGANWTFVIWGALHGSLLVIFWLIKTHNPITRTNSSSAWAFARGLAGWAITFILVCIGWVFFRSVNIQQAFAILGMMAGWTTASAEVLLPWQRWSILLVVAGCLLVELVQEHSSRLLDLLNRVRYGNYLITGLWHLQPLLYITMMVLTLVLKPPAGAPFIYFQF